MFLIPGRLGKPGSRTHIIRRVANKRNDRPHDNTDRAGRSEIHYAVIDRNLERIKELLRQGTNVNLADRDGWTPFILRHRTMTKRRPVFCLIPAPPLTPETPTATRHFRQPRSTHAVAAN